MHQDLAPLLVRRRQFVAGALAGTISLATGCGTILYPERRGQPSGQLDWGVVLLDGVGLILFFVPGLIAFAVDFATGAIYLPPREEYQLSSEKRPALRQVAIDTQRLSPAEIAKVVNAETGAAITLEDGTYVATKLGELDGFWAEHDRLAAVHGATQS